MQHRFAITCARHLTPLLQEELAGYSFSEVREQRYGVQAVGSLVAAYRACLWSRLASRVLMTLATGPATDADALYATARSIDWDTHLGPADTLAVTVASSSSPIRHDHFAAQRVKDAIVDQLRTADGVRPTVQPQRPHVMVHVLLRGREAVLSLDLSGEPLHRRGYRVEQGAAPLRETLAAALLQRCRWPTIAAAGGAFVDPMCGAGTLLIEAAWMAGDVAPGLPARRYWGFLGWRGHDAAAWRTLWAEAETRAAAGRERLPPLFGFDVDGTMLRLAQGNLQRAGLADDVRLARHDLRGGQPLPLARDADGGLLLTNPPWGERLGDQAALAPLYAGLGRVLREDLGEGWRAGVFTGNPRLGRELGLHAQRTHRFLNGRIDCRLLQFDLAPTPPAAAGGGADAPPDAPAAAEALVNRLHKQLRHLGRWRRREDVTCYRLYDAELPEYRVAVDVYETTGGEVHAHVQEYAAPARVDPERARARFRDACQAVAHVLAIAPHRVHRKRRERQRGASQYQRQAERGEWLEVGEYDYRVWVNLDDYLDTGLFLDHRPVRGWIREEARDRHFLNLFAYTGVATVAAAVGGAASTTTVDLSNTYLDWASRNLALNGVTARVADARDARAGTSRHRLERGDVMAWLGAAAARGEAFDLIFADPPTFSRSKRVEGTFDVQRDHVALLSACRGVLAAQGTVLFSNNLRSFTLDEPALVDLGYAVHDVTGASLPPDFARSRGVHRCWRLQH